MTINRNFSKDLAIVSWEKEVDALNDYRHCEECNDAANPTLYSFFVVHQIICSETGQNPSSILDTLSWDARVWNCSKASGSFSS